MRYGNRRQNLHGFPKPARQAKSVGQIDRKARIQGTKLQGAREQQQVRDEPAHPPGAAQRGRGRLTLLAVQLVGEQLEVREHRGERRAQLVRGVRHEGALSAEHRLEVDAEPGLSLIPISEPTRPY